MTYNDLADLIFPDIKHDIKYYEEKYPERNLKEGAIVTRYAPSPTGFVHIGALLASFTSYSFAHQTEGVFYLRIEDTDTKRKVEDGVSKIIKDLKDFDITFSEGATSEDEENGEYGPYTQSKRKEIYHTFIKELIKEGKAYPCFLTEEEVNAIRERQEKHKDRIGIYGKYAKYRDLTPDEAAQKIKNGEEYIIRLKSPGDFYQKVKCNDLIRGELEFPENDLDIPIMKKDGLPTYHFAHLVDDHLMHTTHVIRADEWVSSLPIHLQLFQVFGFKAPKYAHISPLLKNDNGVIRKLSKRKDPECAVSFYHEMGIPNEAVKLYLATIMHSNFEEWYLQNKDKKISDFEFSFKKVSKSGALFDLEKLSNISKTYISRLNKDELYDQAIKYLAQYDQEFLAIFSKDPSYTKAILNIEREQKKPRKDIGKYEDIKNLIWYMYDELFTPTWDNKDIDIDLISAYLNECYDDADDKNTWFNKINEFGLKNGYTSVKEYKENPDKYKGHIGDICEMLRYTITSLTMTPDLYEIMRILGKERILKRVEQYKNNI